MFSPILNPDQLQALQKAADSLSKSDKQKEKMMDEIRLNGKEWNGISAGREEVGIPKPKKVFIEDLAEKAKIINESRDIVYQLQQNKAFAETKQAEFFAKQAKPIVEGEYEIYNQKTGQYEKVGLMNAIKENLAKNGLIAEKIDALSETIQEIVDSIEIEDGLENIRALIKSIVNKIDKLPAFKNDGAVIEKGITDAAAIPFGKPADRGVAVSVPSLKRETSSGEKKRKPTPMPPSEAPPTESGESESKADPLAPYDIYPSFNSEMAFFMNKTLSKKITLVKTIKPKMKQFLEEWYLKNKDDTMPAPTEDIINNYSQRTSEIRKEMKRAEDIAGKGMPFGKPVRAGFKAPTFQDLMSKSNDKLLKQTISQGKGVDVLALNKFGREIKSFLSGSGHKGSLKIENMNNQDLMKALTLNIASQKAGNSGVGDMINATIDEMLRRKLIKKAEHKKLWYQFCG